MSVRENEIVSMRENKKEEGWGGYAIGNDGMRITKLFARV